MPTSDHNMHMDNPDALARAIVNDVYGLKLELKPNNYLLHGEGYDGKSAACFDKRGMI